MCLISWIHPRGSKTVTLTQKLLFNPSFSEGILVTIQDEKGKRKWTEAATGYYNQK
jgi:hypothetical protein